MHEDVDSCVLDLLGPQEAAGSPPFYGRSKTPRLFCAFDGVDENFHSRCSISGRFMTHDTELSIQIFVSARGPTVQGLREARAECQHLGQREIMQLQ